MADIKRAKCINAPNIVIFSLILIVLLLGASMIFLLLEDPVLVSTTKKTNPVTTDSTKISLATECNPQSLKIGDKVCDDDTNFEKCLFDGGDCCLETKSTPFCRDCMCKMKEQTQAEMETVMKSNGNIQIFNIDTRKQNDPLIEKIQMVKRMRIWNVADENVCTLICLEATNAWLYDASEMDCLCLGLKLVASTKKLIQKLDPADLPSDSQDSLFFVKMDNFLSDGKILIFNGNHTTNDQIDVLPEIHHLEDPEAREICYERHLLENGTKQADATTGFLGKTLITCGGAFLKEQKDMDYTSYGDTYNVNSNCFRFGDPKPAASMLQPRAGAASIVIDNSLFIAGGFFRDENIPLRTTEFIKLDKTIGTPGPILPYYGRRHQCFVKVNANTGLLIGGHYGYAVTETTYYYHVQDKIWTVGPKLVMNRYGHMCAVTKDGTVLVAGGKHVSGLESVFLNTVEILSSGSKEFILGPELPYAITKGALVSNGLRDLVLIGSLALKPKTRPVFLQFTCHEEEPEVSCNWQFIPHQLISQKINSFDAVPIPEDFEIPDNLECTSDFKLGCNYCKLPFEYKGMHQNTCSNEDNGGRFWCALDYKEFENQKFKNWMTCLDGSCSD